jgi:hypothetical protein
MRCSAANAPPTANRLPKSPANRKLPLDQQMSEVFRAGVRITNDFPVKRLLHRVRKTVSSKLKVSMDAIWSQLITSECNSDRHRTSWNAIRDCSIRIHIVVSCFSSLSRQA